MIAVGCCCVLMVAVLGDCVVLPVACCVLLFCVCCLFFASCVLFECCRLSLALTVGVRSWRLLVVLRW